jgi:hypothetical protein
MSTGLLVQPGVSSTHVAALEAPVIQPTAAVRASLWGMDDLRRLLRVLALSGTGLVVAWLVASGTTDPARQEYAVAGGIVATALAVAGLAGWLLAGMRTLRQRREGAVHRAREVLARRTGTADSPATAGALVTAKGMTHYHRASCLMVRGKAVRAVRGTRLAALTACPVCRPGESP